MQCFSFPFPERTTEYRIMTQEWCSSSLSHENIWHDLKVPYYTYFDIFIVDPRLQWSSIA